MAVGGNGSPALCTERGERFTIGGSMRARGAALALPAMVGSVWVQAHRAARADLPEYDDLDVTGYYGPEVAGAPRLRVAAVGDSTLTGPGLDHARDTFVARVASGAGVP